MRGDFGLETDDDTKRRRGRIVPRVEKPEPPKQIITQVVAENPPEKSPDKKPHKPFKMPKPGEIKDDGGGELEAKLQARAMKDLEMEAEEQARREIAAEERKKREEKKAKMTANRRSVTFSVTPTPPKTTASPAPSLSTISDAETETETETSSTSTSSPQKIAIPKAFDVSQQEPENAQSLPPPQIQLPKEDQSQQQQQQEDGGKSSQISMKTVEALLEDDDFDALEKLYDDYWS